MTITQDHWFYPSAVRMEIIKAMRAFFDSRHFQEIMVPTLHRALPLEPTLYAFETKWFKRSEYEDLYLSISPESSLKKMMARGVGNCFAIGKCFRNLESNGQRHNPEFLMLEWYRQPATYKHIMVEAQELITFTIEWLKKWQEEMGIKGDQKFAKELLSSAKWERISIEELFVQKLGLQLSEVVSDEGILKVATQLCYQTEDASWEQLFNQIMLNEIEPTFPKQPFFLCDFPARLSPLCQIQTEKPYLAERFELFINGMEIANGNTEKTDALAVEQAFVAEQKYRQQAGYTAPPIDQSFLNALANLSKQETSWAGIGLGVDRLAMILANTTEISDVEPFVF